MTVASYNLNANLDMQGNEIVNVLVNVVTALPASGSKGQIVYYDNATTGGLYSHNGTLWSPVSSSADLSALTARVSANETAISAINNNKYTDATGSFPTTDDAKYPTCKAVVTYVAGQISTLRRFCGSVKKYTELATKSPTAQNGDTWNVIESFDKGGTTWPAGTDCSWNGTDWVPLGEVIDLSVFALKDDVTTGLAGKVDKNGTDRLMTDAEGTKLAGVEASAQVNVIETIKVNGTPLTPTTKAVDITVPTIPATGSDGKPVYFSAANTPVEVTKVFGSLIDGKISDTSSPWVVSKTAVTLVAGTAQAVAHGCDGLPYVVTTVDSAGKVTYMDITMDATNITLLSNNALTVTVGWVGKRA